MFDENVFTDVSAPIPEAIGAGSGDAPVPNTSRTDSLVQARDQKLSRLSSRVGYGPTDRTNDYQVIDGYNESMGNKILNDYSPYELEYLGSRLNNEYGVIETPEGLMRQSADGTMVPYEGDANDLMSYYEYGTKDGNIKRGTWGGRDPAGRYSDEYLSTRLNKAGQPEHIGEAGVDVNQLKRHYLLPADIARTYEALYHGSSQAMQNRVARQQAQGNLAEYQAARDRIGSGATEVYRNVDATAPENFNGDELFSAINERFQLSPQARQAAVSDVAQRAEEIRNRGAGGAVNRLANTGSAVASSAVRSLLFDSAAAVASMFGGELGTADSRRELADDIFGYDRSFSQDAMERVSDRITRIYDEKDMDMNDVLSIAGDAITNPEILGESVGTLIGTMVGLGKFTKVGKAVGSVEKSYRAGNITKSQAKDAVSKIKSTASLMDNVAHLTAKGAGYGATVTGMTGNAVDEFMANNGEEADVYDVLRIGALNAAIAGVDRFAGQIALRDIPGIRKLNMFSPESTKALKAVVNEMPPSLYAKTAESVANVLSGTAKLGGTAALEGATEYAQTMGELFSTQYATEKYGDDFGQIFADRANQIEALTGAAIGAAMGSEMYAGNLAAQTLQSGVQKGVAAATKPSTAQATATTPEETQAQDEDRKLYNSTLTRLRDQFTSNSIKPESLADNLADIEALRRTRSSVANADPAKLAQADATLKQIEDTIAATLMASPDGNLTLNRITGASTDSATKPVTTPAGEAPKTTLGSKPLTPAVQRALAESAIDLVASRKGATITPEETAKLNTFGTTNGVDPRRVERIILSHASVENEATQEARGIFGRERALDLELGSGTPNTKRIQKSYDETAQFLSTTLASISALEEGIREAEEKAATANNSARKTTAPIKVITGYQKAGSSSKKPSYFDIQVTHDGTKYVPQTRTAIERITDKKRTAVGLNALLNKFHQEAAAHIDSSSALTGGGYRVPETAKESKGATSETNYVKAVDKALASLPDTGKSINKIIVGAEPEARWSPQSVRARQNSLRINSASKGTEYSSEDVVYVHAGGKYNTKKKGEEAFYNSELYKTSSPAGKEIAAAMAAGATIVLDSQFKSGTPEGVLLSKYMQAHGYIPAGATGEVEASIFVPDTEANARRLAESKERAAATKAKDDERIKRKARLADLAVEEAATTAPTYKGRTTEEVQSDVTSAIEAVREDFLPLAKKQVQDSLAEGEELTTEAVEEQLMKNIRNFMKNSTTKAVREFRLEAEREGVNLDEVENLDPALRALVEADTASTAKVESDSKVLINAWKAVSTQRLSGQALIGALNKALEPTGKHVASTAKDENTIVLRDVGDTVLYESAGSTNNIKSYAIEYQVIGTDGNVTTEIKYPVFNPNEYPVGKKTGDLSKGTAERTILNVNEVVHNPTEYLTVSNTTPLNTIPTENLPKVFGRVSARMEAALKEVMPPLSKSELSIPAGKRDVDKEVYVRNMMDSPARSLIYDKEGKINPSMTLAMGVALGDLIKTDSFKLTLGSKDTKTLANMFRVSEAEVTAEMRKMAAENGTLMKSVAHNLGTSALKALGIGKLKHNQVNRGQYERMVADLGNYIIAAAEQEGILKTTQEKSSDLSEVYRDGDATDTGSVTWFVHLPSTKSTNKATGVFTTTLNKGAVSLSADYELITGFMPDPTSNIKEPRFGSPIPQEEQEDILSSIRNDAVGGNIPAEAKETLRTFMDTPYIMDMDNVSKLLSELDDPENRAGVLKSLGYIEISEKNPDYVKLPFRDKEIQEAINRDVENSIEHIRNYYEAIQNGLPNEMYFPFYYTSNHRYMMNSNTLNGQADKFHRFLVIPQAHATKYDVNRVDNTFTYNYMEGNEAKSIDSSLYVRAALAQAMGIDIDKSATNEIVRVGNTLLSMTAEDAVAARESMLKTGSFTLTTEAGVTVYEPAHLSHGLQGLEFIRKYKSSNSTSMTDALSAEYDALTSGFSNKVQQFGTVSTKTADGTSVSTRSEHMRRVGIIGPDNNTAEMFQDAGVGVNDMLSDKTLLDSYKNLAKDTILDLNRHVKALPAKQAKLFDALSVLLPGADQRSVDATNVTISSALRKLFKPGFMIFNYSAGINRIVINLGDEMVSQMFKDIAVADLKVIPEDQKAAMQAIADMVYVGAGKPLGISVAQLQERIRNEPSSSLRTAVKEWSQSKNKFVVKERLLTDVLVTDIIKPTYGASVEESFAKNFDEFIQIQNVTNDAFKLSFAVFTQLLQQKVSEYRAVNNNAPITEEQMLGFIAELRDAFPVIAGPLSDSLQDGVYVYTTETRTPKGTLSTTVAPTLKYSDKQKAKGRKVNPLIRSLVAAANAGAVLPFHALDGAQMSRTVNEFVQSYMSKIDGAPEGAGIVPIHDAVIPPLPFSDIVGYSYNKNTVQLNTEYSVIGEIQQMAERTADILSGKHKTLKVDGSKIAPIKSLSFINGKVIKENIADINRLERELKKQKEANASDAVLATTKVDLATAKNELSFTNSFEKVLDTVNVWVGKVYEQRATLFREGTKVGVLVTTPGGVYTVGSTGVDLSYLDQLTPLYNTVGVQVAATEVKAKKPVSGSLTDKFSAISEELGVRAAESTGVIYLPPKEGRVNADYENATKGVLAQLDTPISADSTLMVLVEDKSAGAKDKALTDAELAAIEESWSQTIKLAEQAMNQGATLLFSYEDVSIRDLGDDALMGGSYVVNRLDDTGNYKLSLIKIDGISVYQMSKNTVNEAVTLIDMAQDDMMAELADVTNKNAYKNTAQQFKNLTKECK
jgi:hypothetical protein